MKRALVAAMLWAAIFPVGVRAQEPDPSGATPEPESSGADVVAPIPPAIPKGQEQASETYTVRRGDTLWDLSQRFLGNPWYWPKVWSYNPEIENPHWIYPGNIVRFYAGSDGAPTQVEPGEQVGEIGDVSMGSLKSPDHFGQDDDVVAVTSGIRIGYVPPRRSFLRQDGLITRRELDEAGIIEKAWAEKEMLSTFDRVYLRFKNKGAVRLGERYSIFRTGAEVSHPVTGAKYGYLTRIVGTLRIETLGSGLVTGVIDHTLDDIRRGDFVGPLGNFDKQVIVKEASAKVQGVILASLVPHQPLLGEHHVIFIDKGAKDGVEEGNLFTVIRRGDPLYSDGEDRKRYPAEDVATLVVVDVKEAASAALVVRSIRELEIGERVVAKAAATQASARH